MKTLLLFLAFGVATIVPAFCQVSNLEKYDFKLDLPSYDNHLGKILSGDMINSQGEIQLRQFKNLDDFLEKMENNPQLLYRNDRNEVVENPDLVYSLRIVKPTGNYPIQISKPDTTKNYTLLIKKF